MKRNYIIIGLIGFSPDGKKINIKFTLNLLLFCLIITGLQAQDTITQEIITLDECQNWAYYYYPYFKDKDNIKEISQLKLENLQVTWFPKLTLNGQATYQSDVTAINIDLPIPGINIPSADHDQYKMYLDINQQIYDGGVSRALRDIEIQNSKTENSKVDVDLYAIKDKVSQVFFSVLLLDKSREQLNSAKKNLNERKKAIDSGVRNGAISRMNLMLIEAEIIKLNQQITECQIIKTSLLFNLTRFTGKNFVDSTKLFVAENTQMHEKMKRPEHILFDQQFELINFSKGLNMAKNKPKIFTFGQLGYGKPGLNMLNNEFDSYLLIGAGVSWTPWDWKTLKRENKILDIKQKSLELQRELFELNRSIMIDNELSNIEKLQRGYESDQELVKLRREITRMAQSGLENGILTSSEYINELSLETQAEITLESRKIQLQQSFYRLQHLYGNVNLNN
jgi:outer membrane protein TolC